MDSNQIDTGDSKTEEEKNLALAQSESNALLQMMDGNDLASFNQLLAEAGLAN